MNVILSIALLVVISVFSSPVWAEVQINEIYPAPANGSFEWVELYNNSDLTASLALYSLHDNANRAIVLPTTNMLPRGYIIATSSGVLNNSGDSVVLRLNDIIIDSVTYTTSTTSNESFIPCSGEWIVTDIITPTGANQCPIQPTQVATPTQTIVSTAASSPTEKLPQGSHSPAPHTPTPIPSFTVTPHVQVLSQIHAVRRPTPTPSPSLSPILIDAASCKAVDVDSFKPFIAGILACGFITGGVGCYSIYQKVKRKDYNGHQNDSISNEVP